MDSLQVTRENGINIHYNKIQCWNKFLFLLFLGVLLILKPIESFGQPPLPNHSITVRATQALNFGAFYITTGGFITVTPEGAWSSTGITRISSSTIQPAIFEIKLCQGRNIYLTNYHQEITLNGSNGGSLKLNLIPEDKAANGKSFQVNGDCNFITPLRFGGTLTVPEGANTGIYIGSFSITFNQE